jgi:hypothetical protein
MVGENECCKLMDVMYPGRGLGFGTKSSVLFRNGNTRYHLSFVSR